MMEHGSRTRLTTALVLAVVFASGVLLGFAADGRLGASPAPAATPVAATGAEAEPERRAPMYRQVDPTEEQLLMIESIVKEHRARTNELDKATRATYRQGFREILLETREEIKSVLGPEQATRYQRLLDEHDARQAAESEQDRND